MRINSFSPSSPSLATHTVSSTSRKFDGLRIVERREGSSTYLGPTVEMTFKANEDHDPAASQIALFPLPSGSPNMKRARDTGASPRKIVLGSLPKTTANTCSTIALSGLTNRTRSSGLRKTGRAVRVTTIFTVISAKPELSRICAVPSTQTTSKQSVAGTSKARGASLVAKWQSPRSCTAMGREISITNGSNPEKGFPGLCDQQHVSRIVQAVFSW